MNSEWSLCKKITTNLLKLLSIRKQHLHSCFLSKFHIYNLTYGIALGQVDPQLYCQGYSKRPPENLSLKIMEDVEQPRYREFPVYKDFEVIDPKEMELKI